jgi:drug/metabolite transporter (DMT)-like permease
VSRARAEAALLAVTLVWGCTFIMVKEALDSVSTVLFLALRFSVATLALLLVFRRPLANRRYPPGAVRSGVLVGLFLFAGYILQTLGLRLTTAPKSAFLTGLATVMVPLLAMLVYRIRPRAAEIGGVLLAAAGTALMTLQGSIGSINRGDLLTLGCAVAFAMHIVAVGHYSRDVSFELLSVTQIGTAAALSLSLFWWVEPPAIHWRPSVLFAILVTGVLATALAFTVQAWAQRYTTSTRTALIFALEPVFAWMTSYLVMGEGLSSRSAAGAGMILGGVLLVEMKPLQPGRHPSQ